MARNLTVLMILIFMIGLVPVDFVQGEPNSQGLEWGFQEDDQFDYTFRVITPEIGRSYSEKVIVTVVYLEELTYSVGGFMDLGHLRGSIISWKNGTPALREQLPAGVWDALPIGNWSVFSEIVGNTIHYQIHDSFSTWGYTLSFAVAGRSSTTTMIYSKTDGVIQKHFHRLLVDGSIEYLMEFTREGYVSNLTIIVGLAGAGVMLTVIGITVRRRRALPV